MKYYVYGSQQSCCNGAAPHRRVRQNVIQQHVRSANQFSVVHSQADSVANARSSRLHELRGRKLYRSREANQLLHRSLVSSSSSNEENFISNANQ